MTRSGKYARVPAAIVALLAVCLLTAGCGASGGNQAEKSVTLWYIDEASYGKTIRAVADRFEADNPGVTVQIRWLSWDNYQQQILAGVAGGNAPDVVEGFYTDLAQWADQGLVAPLEVKTDDLIDAAKQQVTYEGKTYGLPLGVSFRALWYNRELMKKAGINQPPSTWQELREAAVKLTRRDKNGKITRVGLWLNVDDPFKTIGLYRTMLQANGGDVWDANGKPGVATPEAIETMTFLRDLLTRDKVDSPGAITDDPTDFIPGKAAMMVSNSAISGSGDDASLHEKFGVAPLPAGPSGKSPAVTSGGNVLGVTSRSKNPELATKLAVALTKDTQNVLEIGKVEQLYPAYAPAADSAQVEKSYWLDQYGENLVDHATPLPVSKNYNEAATDITDALNGIYLNGDDPGRKLRQVAKSLDGAI